MLAVTPVAGQERVRPGAAESKPVAVALDRASATATGGTSDAALGPDASAGASSSSVAPPAAVDAQTYAREKAEAARGPAPTGATRLAVPEARSGSADPSASAAPSVPLNFAGLNRQTAVNNGFVFNPPDTIVGKSPNRVLEGANSALRLFNTSGGVIATSDMNTFFGASTTNGRLFDPKVYYDRNATNPRFFVVGLQAAGKGDTNAANDVSRIWVAVARSSDPANLSSSNWCRYNIEGRRNVGTSDVSWADYPQIGAGRDSFSFAVNNFRFTNSTFTYAVIHVWNKTIATNNASSCPSIPQYTFQPSSTIANFTAFTIQPAQSYTSPSSFSGTTNPAYYMSTTRGSSNQYHVYRIRNVASASPTLTSVTLTGHSYIIPPASPQPSSSIVIDTGDNRMLQVAGIGNTLVGMFTTGCNFSSPPNESCSLAPRVTVGQNGSGGLTATLVENTFAGFGDNIFVHHQSIATNTSLQSASTWEYSGSANHLRSTAMFKNVNAAWSGVSTYAAGTCSLPATAPSATMARSGDYSGAQLDPALTSFWLAGEEAITIGGSCQWQTRIARLIP
jgi:hypothetical protein